MQIAAKTITPCLWFETQAEEAAKFYVSVFKNSKITSTSRFPDAGQEVHHKPAGSVMVVAFELDGQPFTALNGGPQFKFDEAISFQVMCDTQVEVDHYWNTLTKEGQEGPCGWLKDKNDDGPGSDEIRACHERFPENEKARYRGDRACL
jgi:predicted 3-demethylubiquinone-9 3-methyltransferase (glyoxalase superfamily)